MRAFSNHLKKRTIAAYGVGDVGFNLFYTTLSLFLLVYYTNVLNIDPIIAGTMAAGPVFWDAVTDPLMGIIASRTRTRFGRYRPYILFGAPLCGLSFVAMFAAPVLFPSAIVVSSIVAHILFRTLYTIVNVPYAAMTVVLTDDSKQRGYLAAARMFAAMIAGLFAAVLMFPLAELFGEGNQRLGFVYVASLYASVATVAMLLVFFATSEKPVDTDITPAPRFVETWTFLRSNDAFWILAFAVFCSSTGSTIGLNAINYYVSDYIDAPGEQGLALLPLLLAFGFAIPLWTWVATRTSKARTWIIATVPSIFVSLIMFVIAPKDMGTLAVFQFAKGLFAGAIPVMLWSMVPDTVEYGEWRSGIRDEAIGFGLIQFALKSASSLAAFLLGLYLAAIGYVAPELRDGDLSSITLEGLRWVAFLIPTGITCIGLIVMTRYRLDHNLHSRLSRALNWRRSR